MSKDREFNDVLNQCLERLLDNGETVEQCVQSYPEQSTELEPLLRTAADVRKATRVEPRAEFKARARYQFHRALAELKPKRTLWRWVLRPRWVTAAAVILVVLLAARGMGIATYHSMPGEILYPVRLTAEDVLLGRTPPGLARAQMHLSLMERRVKEITSLAKREYNGAKIEQVAQRLDYHLAMIESLAAAETVVARPHVVEVVRPLTGLDAPVVENEAPVAEIVVEEAVPVGPAGPAGPAGADAMRLMPTTGEVRVAAQAALCPEEAARWAEFRLALKEQAADHLAALRGLLPVVSESARPALLTAIAVMQAGHERAIGAGERE
jgi:hypothetical protein